MIGIPLIDDLAVARESPAIALVTAAPDASGLELERLSNQGLDGRMGVSASCIKAPPRQAILKLGVLAQNSISAQHRSHELMQLAWSNGPAGAREAARCDL